jgi:hypothetical protein
MPGLVPGIYVLGGCDLNYALFAISRSLNF